eukprot:TRINITY_DN4753_c0_g1_i3.p1 TRINITY_DN4753_c0_g1~~TRINITY_DN4753_c0_g1_i3.p1  ORF type:complete len:467 (+),score=110.68 TRINITY_DN4753_c0_g1_i3:69-1469(+)
MYVAMATTEPSSKATCTAHSQEYDLSGFYNEIRTLRVDLEEKSRDARLAAELGYALLQKNRALQEQCASLENQVFAQSIAVEERELIIQTLRQENDHLVQKLSRTDEMLSAAELSRISLTETLRKMSLKNDRLEKECEKIHEMRKEKAIMMSELADFKRDAGLLLAKLHHANETIKAHQQTIESQNKTIILLQSNLQKREAELSRLTQLESHLRHAFDSNQKYSDEIQFLEEENTMLKEFMAEKEKETQELKDKSLEAILQCHAQLNEARQTINYLADQLDMLQACSTEMSFSEEVNQSSYEVNVPDIAGPYFEDMNDAEQLPDILFSPIAFSGPIPAPDDYDHEITSLPRKVLFLDVKSAELQDISMVSENKDLQGEGKAIIIPNNPPKEPPTEKETDGKIPDVDISHPPEPGFFRGLSSRFARVFDPSRLTEQNMGSVIIPIVLAVGISVPFYSRVFGRPLLLS